MNLSVLFLFFLFTTINSFPVITDIHETTIDVKRLLHTPNDDIYALDIDREDDLYVSGTNTPIAHQTTHVKLVFDVHPQSFELTLNGQAVPYGVSQIIVKSDVIKSIKKTKVDLSTIGSIQFDQGIVSIKIEASGHTGILPNGKGYRRTIIMEKIFEVDGVYITQSKYMQQVIDIIDGKLVKYAPEPLIDLYVEKNQDSSKDASKNTNAQQNQNENADSSVEKTNEETKDPEDNDEEGSNGFLKIGVYCLLAITIFTGIGCYIEKLWFFKLSNVVSNKPKNKTRSIDPPFYQRLEQSS